MDDGPIRQLPRSAIHRRHHRLKITSVTLWHVDLTSHATYYMASGKACATVTTVMLRLDTDAGLVGWGEVCPIPHYLAAYANGVASAIQELAPILLGTHALGPEAVMHKMDRHLPGHVYAKSALDITLWDLMGKAAGMPLYELLGGRLACDLPLYHSITCVAPDEMARIAKDAFASGIRQFQAKLGADDDWQADVARLRLVREAVGNGPLVYGDWNCGSTQLNASRVGRAVADLDIMLERPCTTLEQCAQVRAATGLPMKIDENAHDTASLIETSNLGVLEAVALKLSKFGGVSALRRARDLCLHLGAELCIEDTWGSDIATAAALHLAASTDPAKVLNVCDLSGYVTPRLAPEAPTRQAGRISVPHMPGLGIEIDGSVLGDPIAVIS